MSRWAALFHVSTFSRSSIGSWVLFGALAAIALGSWAAFGFPRTLDFQSNGSESKTSQSQAEGDQPRPTSAKTHVVLSPVKLAEAKLAFDRVRKADVCKTAIVPGRLEYDPTLRLEMTSPVDCVIKEVFAKPAQLVKQGEPLFILASSDVGMARDSIGVTQDELGLAKRDLEHADEILTNARQLLTLLGQAPTPTEVARQFAGRRLGEHREHLLAAYSKVILARKALGDAEKLGANGSLSGRVVEQRASDVEVATAGFESQQETTLFECLQNRARAAAKVAQSERHLKIATGRLRSLLGSLAVTENTDENADISDLIVVAPRDGRIEDRIAVKSQRLKTGDTIAAISETSHLWLAANIHEHEWKAISLKANDSVTARLPALENREFTAKVKFLGARLDEETHSAPLVAEIENVSGLLKPGLFVWVSVPLETPHAAIVVASDAVMRHDDKTFVFVCESDQRFRRADVKLGQEEANVVEVLQGVSVGDKVVSRNAFLLKSELLLEQEE